MIKKVSDTRLKIIYNKISKQVELFFIACLEIESHFLSGSSPITTTKFLPTQ